MDYSSENIDDQLKEVQRDKYIAERKKAESEQRKIEFEHSVAEKEHKKNKFLKISFTQIYTIITGLTFLGFYINYVAIPLFDTKNIQLGLELAKKDTIIHRRENALSRDSIEINKIIDSIKIVQVKLKFAESAQQGLVVKYNNQVKDLLKKLDDNNSVNRTILANAKQEFDNINRVYNDSLKKLQKYYISFSSYKFSIEAKISDLRQQLNRIDEIERYSYHDGAGESPALGRAEMKRDMERLEARRNITNQIDSLQGLLKK